MLTSNRRFSHIEDGTCIIGMQKKAMMPLIIFDAAVNVYLTTLFIVPLRRTHHQLPISIHTR